MSNPTMDGMDAVHSRQMAVPQQGTILRGLAESVAQPRCRLLEIGSWCGDSASVLGEVAKARGGKLYCIDWWKGNIGTALEGIAAETDVFSLFWARMRQLGLEDTVIPLRGRSDDIIPILAESSFDLVYVDGDHRYEGALKDISAARALVKVGGILCGDDCEGRIDDFGLEFLRAGAHTDFHESVHCGVVLAVGETIDAYDINHNIWSAAKHATGWRAPLVAFPTIQAKRQFHPPLLESYNGHNLVRYGRLVYGIPWTIGAFDITTESPTGLARVPSAESIAALKRLIDAPSGGAAM